MTLEEILRINHGDKIQFIDKNKTILKEETIEKIQKIEVLNISLEYIRDGTRDGCAVTNIMLDYEVQKPISLTEFCKKVEAIKAMITNDNYDIINYIAETLECEGCPFQSQCESQCESVRNISVRRIRSNEDCAKVLRKYIDLTLN